MKIEILCTGDEILSGKTVNTNYSYLARRLTENGFNTHWGTTVGDDLPGLVAAMRAASERADAVIVNGGLGPTVDDLSQQAAARAAGVELALHHGWLARIQARYRSAGRRMPDSNKKQAMLPAGSELIDNPIGTACGFALNIGNARFFFTPGVPKELHRMLEEQILPRLQRMRGARIFTRVKRFHTFGIGESRAEILLQDVASISKDGRVKLGFQSHYPQLETKLTAHGRSEEELDRIIGPVDEAVRRRLGDAVLCEDDQTVEGEIVSMLKNVGGTIAVVESFTAGRITERLLSKSDGGTVTAGIISADIGALAKISGIPVSNNQPDFPETADSLATSTVENLKSSHKLVVLVDPGAGEAGNESAAEVFISIFDGETLASRTARLPGSPDWVRLGSAELALDCLRRYLCGLSVHERIDFELH